MANTSMLFDARTNKPVPTMRVRGREYYVLPIHPKWLRAATRIKTWPKAS